MKIKLKNVRIAFAHGVFVPQQSENGKSQFSATFLFPPDGEAHKALKVVIDDVGTQAFTKEWPAIKKQKLAKDKLVIHDGDLQTKYEGYAGNLYVLAYNRIRPEVRNTDTTPLVQEDGKLYSGCYVDVILDVSAYNSKSYGPQVSVTLMGVQLRSEGEPLSGGAPRPEESDFETIASGSDADDLT